jgi:chromosome segregation ATPase
MQTSDLISESEQSTKDTKKEKKKDKDKSKDKEELSTMKKKFKVLKQALKDEQDSKQALNTQITDLNGKVIGMQTELNDKERKYTVLQEEKRNLEDSLLKRPTKSSEQNNSNQMMNEMKNQFKNQLKPLSTLFDEPSRDAKQSSA